MKYLVPILLLLTVGGCTSTENNAAKQNTATNKAPTATAKQDGSDKDVICRTEKAMGSFMKTKVCRPKGESVRTTSPTVVN